jgi:hypothetical protein
VRVYPHRPARIVRASAASGRAIRVEMSFYVQDQFYRPGSFVVRSKRDGEIVAISSVTSIDQYSLLVTLRDDRFDDTLEIRPTELFRDYYDSPADTTTAASVTMPRQENAGERFIATRATAVGSDTIVVDFNAPVDPVEASLASGYTLGPNGTIVAAIPDPNDPRRVTLIVSGDAPLGAFGKSYTVTIMKLHSADGRLINDGAGSVVGFTINADDLADVFAYPQPFSISKDEFVTIAGLTRTATVTVYTKSGQPLKTLASSEGNGGVQWDGTDESGRRVPTGIYLYRVTGSTPDGSSHDSPIRKIAVVP